MAKGKSGNVIYNKQPGTKVFAASGKPHASPANVVTGAGPKGSGNWNPMYKSNEPKGR